VVWLIEIGLDYWGLVGVIGVESGLGLLLRRFGRRLRLDPVGGEIGLRGHEKPTFLFFELSRDGTGSPKGLSVLALCVQCL
jgi:hypothetical protein